MAAPKSAAISYVAALVLAAVTVFVFYTLRDYGPESAVRRFHDDVRTGNAEDLQKVTRQSIDSQSVQALSSNIRSLDERSVSAPQIKAMERHPDQVDVLTQYYLPDRALPVIWIVSKIGHIWKVDADATLTATRALM